MNKEFYNIINNNKSKKSEIIINGIIGGSFFEPSVSLEDVLWDLQMIPEDNDIDVKISSRGGNVAVGVGIYNFLKDRKGSVTTHAMSVVGSIASVILLAGKKRVYHNGAMIFIHNPSMGIEGESKDLERAAEDLRSVKESILDIYVDETGSDRSVLSSLMDDETLMNSSEAVRRGFITDVLESNNDDDVKNVKREYFNLINDEKVMNKQIEELQNSINSLTEVINKMSVKEEPDNNVDDNNVDDNNVDDNNVDDNNERVTAVKLACENSPFENMTETLVNSDMTLEQINDLVKTSDDALQNEVNNLKTEFSKQPTNSWKDAFDSVKR